jgi:hypothetical protein
MAAHRRPSDSRWLPGDRTMMSHEGTALCNSGQPLRSFAHDRSGQLLCVSWGTACTHGSCWLPQSLGRPCLTAATWQPWTVPIPACHRLPWHLGTALILLVVSIDSLGTVSSTASWWLLDVLFVLEHLAYWRQDSKSLWRTRKQSPPPKQATPGATPDSCNLCTMCMPSPCARPSLRS